jgi:hypothetical protein
MWGGLSGRRDLVTQGMSEIPTLLCGRRQTILGAWRRLPCASRWTWAVHHGPFGKMTLIFLGRGSHGGQGFRDRVQGPVRVQAAQALAGIPPPEE